MKIDTKIRWLATCVIATALCTTSTATAQGAADTGAVTVVDKLPFPEGPLFVNDQLHWVEYVSNRLIRLDGETRTVLHEQEGCGHNGLALTPNKQLVLICYESSEILYLDLDGNVVERIDGDVNGEPFNHPNDIVFTDEGDLQLASQMQAKPGSAVGNMHRRCYDGINTVRKYGDLLSQQECFFCIATAAFDRWSDNALANLVRNVVANLEDGSGRIHSWGKWQLETHLITALTL